MSIKYTFVHPTKCGGTSCEIYFKQHYTNYIIGSGHNNKCTNTNNSIIIVRDVQSRFFSMFKYWKSGAIDTAHKRNVAFINEHKDKTILDFISLIQKNKFDKLHVGFTWNLHFAKTSHWINNTDYKNIIIVKYCNTLNNKIQQLLNMLNIPNKNISLNAVNVSKLIEKDVEIYENNKEYINEFINDYFKEDVELNYAIDNTPDKFKYVL